MTIHDALARLTAINVYTDPEVSAGTAVIDHDPEEPRHITGIRAASLDFTFTDAQVEQVRDHYRAMDERAGQLLGDWQQLAARFGLPRSKTSPETDQPSRRMNHHA